MPYKKRGRPHLRVVCLEKDLLRAKKHLLEMLRITKQTRDLTFQEQEVALFLIAEHVSWIRIGMLPRRKHK